MAGPEMLLHAHLRPLSAGTLLADDRTEHVLPQACLRTALFAHTGNCTSDSHWGNSSPSVRQYYSYTTDTTCKRVGTQCWVYGCIMVSESLICIKHGQELFERTQAVNIIVWLAIQFMVSLVCVIGCVMYHRYNPSSLTRDSSPLKGKSRIRFESGDDSTKSE